MACPADKKTQWLGDVIPAGSVGGPVGNALGATGARLPSPTVHEAPSSGVADGIEPLEEKAFDLEAELRKLIADRPGLLDGSAFETPACGGLLRMG